MADPAADVLADRARIEEQVAGRTLDRRPRRDGAGVRRPRRRTPTSTTSPRASRGARSPGRRCASRRSTPPRGWSRSGVQPGDTVAIMATNRIEHFLADIGGVHAAATPMSIYNTLSPGAGGLRRGPRAADAWPCWRPPTTCTGGSARSARSTASRRSWSSTRRPAPTATGCSAGTTCSRPGGPAAAEHPTSSRSGTPRSTRTHPRRSSTPRARPGTPRAWCSRHHNVLYEAVSTLEAAGPRGRPDPGQLPAARAHRRAGARALRPAARGQPQPRHRRPGRAARRPRRGAPDGVLRGAARVGEDQDRHLRQARGRPQPRQRQAGPGLDGGRAGVGAGPGGRRHDDAGDRGGLPRRPTRRSSASSSCCSGSTRSPGPAPRPRRCRSRSPSSWPGSASRSSTSTA